MKPSEPASFPADATRFSKRKIKTKNNPAASGMAEVVQRNIQALLERQRSENERKPKAVSSPMRSRASPGA